MEQNANEVKTVIDYSSQLSAGAGSKSINDQYAVAEGNVVNICFSGYAADSAGSDAIIATIPYALMPNAGAIFFTAFDHTQKSVLGCRIDGTNIVANNLVAGHAFWVGVTYIK
ncbi:MAG: hypothetical protein Q4D56_00865 [Bacteroides sp.]|nr:hypothetical protein [Bacteroides sp.]